jgi:RNA polymerase sigma-70 factor, ECF subfamily
MSQASRREFSPFRPPTKRAGSAIPIMAGIATKPGMNRRTQLLWNSSHFFPGDRFVMGAGFLAERCFRLHAATESSFMNGTPKAENSEDGPGVNVLLDRARQGEREPLGQLLQLYRNYLTILATTQLDGRLRRRMNPSDLVQETMLAAHCDFAKFRGTSERELLAWLRQILIHCLHHAIETHLNAKMRDVRREISVEQISAALDRSVVNFVQVLADRGPSPSEPAQQRERAVALADQLARLRPQYRDVIVLRNLQGLSFEEVADRMDRKPGTVRMLWLRAIDKFKQIYEPIL